MIVGQFGSAAGTAFPQIVQKALLPDHSGSTSGSYWELIVPLLVVGKFGDRIVEKLQSVIGAT